jgi:16S rRNA (guanine527-N7)-methyltransferase
MDEIKWPIELTQGQETQFDAYRRLLVEWNERMNLTAITEEKEVYIKHFWDSLAVLTMPQWISVSNQSKRVIDIGTGAGFPGIPLAIAQPEKSFVLVDSLQKRISFLETVVARLGLKNVTCVHARSEDLARDKSYRGQFDFVVSRAVARLNVLMELMCPFLRVGGLGFSYKGPGLDEELKDGQRAAKKLQVQLHEAHSYTLPLEMGLRTIICFEQFRALPGVYPRKAGTPQRKPL